MHIYFLLERTLKNAIIFYLIINRILQNIHLIYYYLLYAKVNACAFITATASVFCCCWMWIKWTENTRKYISATSD